MKTQKNKGSKKCSDSIRTKKINYKNYKSYTSSIQQKKQNIQSLQNIETSILLRNDLKSKLKRIETYQL